MATHVTISTELEPFIRRLVDSGRYKSANEVVSAGLQLLEHQEEIVRNKREALRADIVNGLASGPSEPLDMAEIKRSARSIPLRDVS